MSPNTINASLVKTTKKNETSSVPKLIIACFVFRARKPVIFNWIAERFMVLTIGHNANFKTEVVKKIKEKYAQKYGKRNIITNIYTPEETNTASIKASVEKLKQDALRLASKPTVDYVDIDIIVPVSSSESMDLLFTRFLFGHMSSEQDEWWKQKLGEKVNLKDGKIKRVEYHEMPLETVLGAKEEKETNDDNKPTDDDAQVAAVLCEYTYFLVRRYNQEHKKGNRFIRNTFMRDKADDDRDDKTSIEVGGLSIIPRQWKKAIKDEYKVPKEEDIYADDNIKRLGLEDWDAISFDNTKWQGMREHTQGEWEQSLSKMIVDELEGKSSLKGKFSLIGNDGVLNTWFGLSKNSGFASVIFVNEKTRTVMYCTAGSDFGIDMLWNGDWTTTNISQFLVGLSPQYQQSVTNAKILNKAIDKISEKTKQKVRLFFIGHSLGGGLASNNAIITPDKHAITFNAAGLNWIRVPVSLAVNRPSQLLHPFKRRKRVHLFVIQGEILDVGQSFVSPTPWILDDLTLGIPLPGKAKGYSSRGTRKEIAPPIRNRTANKQGITNKQRAIDKKKDEDLFERPNPLERHSLTNFMDPSINITNIKI